MSLRACIKWKGRSPSMNFKKFALASCLLAVTSLATPSVYAATHSAVAAATADPGDPATAGTATLIGITPVSETEGFVQFKLNTGRIVNSREPVNTSRLKIGDTFPVDDVTSDIIIIIIDLGDVVIIIICY